MADSAWGQAAADRLDLPASAEADAELAELAPDSVIVFDLAGGITYWNPASERL